MTRARAGAAAAVLLPAAVFLAQAREVRARNSITYDETFYLTAAKPVFRAGEFGPLARFGVGPLPVVLAYGPAVWRHGDAIADRPWESTPADPPAVDLARATAAVVVGVPLLALTAGWVLRRTGSAVAAGGAGLLAALSPTVAAHASLAATDACFALFYLAALGAVARHAARPTAGRFAAAGVLLGLAVAAKYSGLVLFPVGYLVGIAADRLGPAPPRLGRQVGRLFVTHPVRLAGLAAVAFGTCWAVTLFEVSADPLSARTPGETPAGAGLRKVFGDGALGDAAIGLAHRLHLPSPAVGAYRQFGAAADDGGVVYPTRLFGRDYPGGHKLYYAYAVLLKSTPAELMLIAVAAIGVVASLVRWARSDDPWGSPEEALSDVALTLGVGVLVVGFSLSAKQFGLRYLLPLYPAVVIVAVGRFHWWAGRRPAVFAAGLAGLVAAQAVAAASVAPRPLSYFNCFCGGPARGPDLLGNSDVDWGQGLVDLKGFLDRAGEPAVLVLPFGNALPAGYGIDALPWVTYPAPPCRFVAAGAGRLHADRKLRVLRTVRPAAVVGHTLFVYDTTDPAVWAAYLAGLRKPEPHEP